MCRPCRINEGHDNDDDDDDGDEKMCDVERFESGGQSNRCAVFAADFMLGEQTNPDVTLEETTSRKKRNMNAGREFRSSFSRRRNLNSRLARLCLGVARTQVTTLID